MKLKLVKASQGFVWLRQGLWACRRQPLSFIGLLGLVASAALLFMGLPIVGPLLLVGGMPLMWLGFMLATRRVLHGERVTPAVLIEPFKGAQAPRRALWQLAGSYVLATLLIMQIAEWLGPGSDVLAEAFQNADSVGELINNPLIQQDMLWRMLLTLPVSLVFWHTPALVLWARLPVSKALFFSAVACWRNLGAFAVYGLGWFGIVVALGLLDRLVLTLIPVPFLSNVLAITAGMWVAAAFYASLYFTVVDCFEPSAPSKSDDQPVNLSTPSNGQA